MATTLKLTGYFAAEAAITFSGTQTLQSLADNEYTNWSDEIDNSTTLHMFDDLRIVMASAAFATPADCGLEIYLIPTVDGTNYPTWTGDTTTDQVHNGAHFVGYVPFTGTTAAQAGVLRSIELPNGKFRYAARNRGNVTTAGSGNFIYRRSHSVQAV